jgi:hypothetical protein
MRGGAAVQGGAGPSSKAAAGGAMVVSSTTGSAASPRSGVARQQRKPDLNHPRAQAIRSRLKFRNMIANNKQALLVRCGESTIANARVHHAEHKAAMVIFEKKTTKLKAEIGKEVHSFSVDQLMVSRSADAHLDMQQVRRRG